jgi:hypothetical protein
MFESLTHVDLLDVMRDRQRAERVAVAERLLAAGRFALARFEADEEEDRSQWYLDGVELVEAELGAELGISRGRAGMLIYRGIALIERFPKLAAVFAAGEVDHRIVFAVIFRTYLVVDPDAVAILDELCAQLAPTWNAMSNEKLKELIDRWVRELDPAAERVAKLGAEGRYVVVHSCDDGLADLGGRVHAADGAALDARLDQLADSVCGNDPRSKDQRRADAVGALAAGASQLACACGGADCTQEGSVTGAGVQVVISVVAEAGTVSGKSDTPGLLPGYGPISASVVRQMAGRAKVRTLPAAEDLRVESRYRPSVAMAEFVRCRDMFCRFPGCTRPAVGADIDHTVPWPLGPTHPSNLKILCRAHHLVKTFAAGWSDVQSPDGTVTWTSPSGRTYATKPGGALFFPQLAAPTAELVIPEAADPPNPGRLLAMPKRHRTRAAGRASRITAERRCNEARLALLGQAVLTAAEGVAAYNEPPF